MKITMKLVSQDGRYSLNEVKRLDLSSQSISGIDNLESCASLNHLLLSHNEINGLYGLEKCRQLWRLDINNNRVKSLDGLAKFIAMGTLNLHGNDINWLELEKIRHLHIIDIILSGNPKLDKDPYYRYHVIDCLPNAWMIDGLLVTAKERSEAQLFIDNSAKTSRPIRRKLPKLQFIPSDLKKRDTFGDWASNLLSKFPINETKTLETDMRRLEFICNWFEEIIIHDCDQFDEYVQTRPELHSYVIVPAIQKNFLKDLLEFRKSNREMCNMILVLLVASLYFEVPLEFFDEMLSYTNLSHLSADFETVKLFCLPYNCRILVCNLLLSAVKIDRDQNIDAGFYGSLFKAIKSLLNDSIRNLNDTNEIYIKNFNKASATNTNNQIRESKYLLATEIIQLFVIVPTFYEHLFMNNGLIELLKLGVDEPRIFEALQNFINDNISQKKTNSEISQQVGSFISNLLKLNARQLLNKKLKRKKFINNINDLGELEGPSTASEILTQKNMSHLLANYLTPTIEAIKRSPMPGDSVVVGKKLLGRIVKYENADKPAVVQFDNINIKEMLDESVDTNVENSIALIMEYFEWDPVRKFWKPEGSTGDINTFNFNGDVMSLMQKKLKKSNLHASNSNLTATSNNTLHTIKTASTIIKLNNADTSKLDKSDENLDSTRSSAGGPVAEPVQFDAQFVKSEQHFPKEANTEEPVTNNEQDKEKKQPLDDTTEEVLKLLNANRETPSEKSAKEKIVNFTLDLTFKNNLNSAPTSSRPNETTAIKIITVNDKPEQMQMRPQTYYAKSFHANKLTRVISKSAAPVLAPHFNPTLKTSKPTASNRALRIVQTALVTKSRNWRNLTDLNLNEFQNRWNEDLAVDDIKILDDNSVHNNSTYSINETFIPKSYRNHAVNNVSFDEANLSMTQTPSVVKNVHVTVPGGRENSASELTHIKTANGNFSFIEPMDDKGQPHGSFNNDLDRTVYTTNFDDSNLEINIESHRRHNAQVQSKSSTPDTNKLDKNNLTDMSCLKCLTSLGYNERPLSSGTFDACNTLHQIYDNMYNGNGHENNQLIVKRNKKGKTIKLQDCTTWLAMTNKVSYENQYGKFNQKGGGNNQFRSSTSTGNQLIMKINQDKQDLPGQNYVQLNGAEKINMLINRKSSRALTSPKKPLLTSPSSQAHLMCKGLRPKNANATTGISIVSKKLEPPIKKGQKL